MVGARQVLVNLLGNAVNFTERGEVQLWIGRARGEARDAAGLRLSFVVEDTGIGIAPSVLAREIRQHAVWTGLPLVLLSAMTACDVERAGRDVMTTKASLGLRVLLVDDNVINREVGREMLRTLGCAFEMAEDGPAAVAAAAQGGFDVILMDCQMPGMDGFEATARIRADARQSNAVRVPIIAVMANAMQGDRERCLLSDMDDYLGKPFKLHELEAMLRRWSRTQWPTPAAIAVGPAARTSDGV